jgi:hypothetical protein
MHACPFIHVWKYCHLASSKWIVTNVHFIAGIAKGWLNPHIKWYQGTDVNIGRPGFLSFHRSVRYFLMVSNVDQICWDWKTNKVFEKISKQVASMTNPKIKLRIFCCILLFEVTSTSKTPQPSLLSDRPLRLCRMAN